MGYISPVVFWQYEDYKRRVEQADKTPDPIPVHPASRIELNAEGMRLFHRSQQHPLYKAKKSEKNVADLTGKGRYINEYV
jgi:hypothetical protein